MNDLERVANAIDDAEIGYSIRLVSLIDGVSTYTLQYDDGSPVLEFPSHGDAAEHVSAKRNIARARAALLALLPPSAEMVDAGKCGGDIASGVAVEIFEAMMRRAIGE